MSSKYLVCSSWSHCFKGVSPAEVRFVYLVDERTLAVMQMNTKKGWVPCSRMDREDVSDSLMQANYDIFDRPEDYGAEYSQTLPAWAGASSVGATTGVEV